MGAAEDAVRRRHQYEGEQTRTREAQRRAAYLREIPVLLPQAAANLARHDYPQPTRTDLVWRGEVRVAWQLYDGNEEYGSRYIYLLGDGVLLIGGSARDDSRLEPFLTSVHGEQLEIEVLTQVTHHLKVLSTSDFKPYSGPTRHDSRC